jgi:hypothetical protein
MSKMMTHRLRASFISVSNSNLALAIFINKRAGTAALKRNVLR